MIPAVQGAAGCGPGARRAESGFTLVELLVALFVFGLLAAAGVGLLRASADSELQLKSSLADLASLSRAANALTSDLGQAVPRMTRNEAGDRLPAFEDAGGGEAGQLFSLVRAGWSNLDDSPRPELQKIAYVYRGGALSRVSFAMLDGAAAEEPAQLLGDLESVAVRFRDAQGEWREDWSVSDPAALPAALELTVKPRGREPHIFLFLVGPRPPRAAGEDSGSRQDRDDAA